MARWTKEQAAGFFDKTPQQKKGKPVAVVARRYHCMIGIDPGTNTGIAIKCDGNIILIETVTIIEAINLVKEYVDYHGTNNVKVRIEDARLRKFFAETGPEKWKGAGSIKRDCVIWETEMERCKINYEMVNPMHVKATDKKTFKALTGISKRTSIHAREAAWMIL